MRQLQVNAGRTAKSGESAADLSLFTTATPVTTVSLGAKCEKFAVVSPCDLPLTFDLNVKD
jgi:hypothetical protein